jgi:hypothetical protein
VVGKDGESLPLTLIPWNISAPVLVPVGAKIAIYDQAVLEHAIQAKDKHLPRPLFDLSLPPGSKSCLIVAKPAANQGWNLQVYDESTSQYAAGSRLLLNLTSYKLSGICGKMSFEIPPQGAGLIKPGSNSSDDRAIVQVFATLPTRKATVLDEQWAFPPRSRGVLIVFEAEGGAVRLVGIPDEVPPEPTPVAKGN